MPKPTTCQLTIITLKLFTLFEFSLHLAVLQICMRIVRFLDFSNFLDENKHDLLATLSLFIIFLVLLETAGSRG